MIPIRAKIGNVIENKIVKIRPSTNVAVEIINTENLIITITNQIEKIVLKMSDNFIKLPPFKYFTLSIEDNDLKS